MKSIFVLFLRISKFTLISILGNTHKEKLIWPVGLIFIPCNHVYHVNVLEEYLVTNGEYCLAVFCIH